MSDRITCPRCNGTGCSDKKTLMKAYKAEIEYYRKELTQWKNKTKILNRALKKLTEEEVNILSRAIQGFY